MNQRRDVLLLQAALEQCRRRSADLPRALRTQLELEAWGWSTTRQLDPRTPIQRELDRLFRTTYEAPTLHPRRVA